MSFSCIQPVMAAQAVPDVESVSGEAVAQAEGNEDTNVSVSAAPAKEETSEAPAESTENTPTEETAPAETTESTQEEVVSEPAAEEPQPTKVLSFENTKDKLSVELTKESDFDPGSTADIHLLKDNAYKDLVENLKKSLEAKNKGYTVSLDTLLATEVNVLDDGGNKKDAGKVSTKIFKALNLNMGYVQRAHCLYQDNEEELDHAVTLLAYDMLFGDDYVYDGQSPVPEVGEKPMIMGLEEIGISRVSNEGDHAVVRGRNFNEYSKVYDGEDQLETLYVD